MLSRRKKKVIDTLPCSHEWTKKMAYKTYDKYALNCSLTIL